MKKTAKDKPASKKTRLVSVKPSGEKEHAESMVDLIHDLVRQIPKGRVTSYGAISQALNLPNPRMVGRAMGLPAKGGKTIPYQRVVNSTGHLSGGHQSFRRQLLLKEGVKVVGDKVIGFRELFWDPVQEL
jgi:methylated-DNA-protein-cysteine methyltransferase related protein